MNRVAALVAEHCPDGVASQPLGDLCIIKTGPNINRQLIADRPGPYPVINSGREPLGYVEHFNTEDDPIGIASRGSVGLVTWTPGRFFRGNLNYSCTVRNPEQLNNRFLYHYLLYADSDIQALATHQGIPALNAGALRTLQVPVPPPTVQTEIAAILDAFGELTMELTAELMARSTQFHHYRDQLLRFDDEDVQWVALADVAEFKRGQGLGSTDFVPGPYPVVTASKTEIGKHAAWNFGPGSVTITSHGAYAGHVNYWPTPIWLANNVFLVLPGAHLTAKFLYHFLKCNEARIQGLAKGGGVPYFNTRDIAPLLVPIPRANNHDASLAAQREIVRILDSFETLIHSPHQGLAGEIALRQRQYAYYRDRLLSFPKPEELAN